MAKSYTLKCKWIVKVFTLLSLFTFSNSWGQTSNLFISEYVEGSSSNKYLEIYNGTGVSVNLSNYVIRLYANGSSSATNSFTLSGTLATCSVCVIANGSATLAVTPNFTSAVIGFNGDDAITLETTSGIILDVFGNIGCAPTAPAAWTSGTLTTVDKTLVRNASVCAGVGDAGGNCPFATLGTEWTQFNTNDVSNLGAHAITCASCASTGGLSVISSPSSQTVCVNTPATISTTVVGSPTSYQWMMSSNNSTWTAVASGTPTGMSYSGGTTGTLVATSSVAVNNYYYQCVISDGVTTLTTTTSTIKVDGITTQPYNAVITTAQTATFAVVASGSPSSYQWQVNSGAGFSNVTNGGVYAGATASLVTITNPSTSMNSYSYQCIVTYTCGTTTSSTAVLFVSSPSVSTCPQMTGAFINACNGACSEGDNEILFFNSGSATIPVSPTNINVTYGSVSSPTTTFTDAFTTNAAYTASLNAMSSASCTTLFIDAMATGTIPANSVFMILRNTACFTFDFSSFCPANTVYVLYSSDASWLSGGNFTNGGSVGELRHFTSNFSAVAGGCVTNNNYQPNYLGGGDGASVSFVNGGGAANAYFNNGCTPPPLVLPIELLDFYATKNGKINDLVWKVVSEINVVYYTIAKSNDGVNFTELANVFTNYDEGVKSYTIIDDAPFDDITYYRLGTIEKDGTVKYHKIISVDEKSAEWDCYNYQQEQNLIIEFKNNIPKDAELQMFDLSGQLLVEVPVKDPKIKINTQAFAQGIYFVKIATPYKIENFKIIISK